MRSLAAASTLALTALLGACAEEIPEPTDAGVDARPTRDAGTDAGPTDYPLKGPWAQRPTTTEIRIRWESQLAPETVGIEIEREDGTGDARTIEGVSHETVTQVSYGIGQPAVEFPDVPGTYFVQEVDVDALEPATCYTYTLVGFPDEGGRFCTMHEADDTSPITFYAIGDTSPTGGGTLDLFDALDPADTEFTVHLGDIQYYTVIVESQQVWFNLMPPMLRANAFLPCIGNHEVDADPVEHEFEDYYLRLFAPAGVDGDGYRYHFESGGVHFFSLSSEHDLGPDSEQVDWFVETLERVEAEPGYRFSVLYSHRPLFTIGDSNPPQDQRDSLLPIIEEHAIPLVLAGHVHAYERFVVPYTGGGSSTFVTSGAGGFRDREVDQLAEDHPDWLANRVFPAELGSEVFYQAMAFEIVRETDGTDVIRGRAVDAMGIDQDTFEIVVPAPTP